MTPRRLTAHAGSAAHRCHAAPLHAAMVQRPNNARADRPVRPRRRTYTSRHAAAMLILLSLVAIDVGGATLSDPQSVSLLTDNNTTFYVTPDNFYVFSKGGSDSSTVIDKLSLQDGDIQMAAVGQVPGTIFNQFSVGVNGPYLYIATTTDGLGYTSNNVFVLTQAQGTLDIIGSLENLAPGESTYAVEFIGDRGFVCTFRQVDPLFALDLSDPTAPRCRATRYDRVHLLFAASRQHPPDRHWRGC